jgi:hypothetical protein
MRLARQLIAVGAALAAALIVGCGPGDDGVDHAAVAQLQAPLVAAAKHSGGDWSKLSPVEQKLFLDRARGNENSAKQIFGMMGRAPKVGGPSR